jgi:hypothetical protein
LAVGAEEESGSTIGINGDENDNSTPDTAYQFRSDGIDWIQQTYVNSPNAHEGDNFGVGFAAEAAAV